MVPAWPTVQRNGPLVARPWSQRVVPEGVEVQVLASVEVRMMPLSPTAIHLPKV